MEKIMIAVILVLVCAYGGYRYLQKLRRGGGCCGSHEPMEKKVWVADRNESHYPYRVTLVIDGMTCGNCARRVENVLNRMDGTWAAVDLGAHQAQVRLKQPPDEALLRRAIRESGYTVLSMQTNFK